MRSVASCSFDPQFFSRLKSLDDPALYNYAQFAEMQDDRELLLMSFIGGRLPFSIDSCRVCYHGTYYDLCLCPSTESSEIPLGPSTTFDISSWRMKAPLVTETARRLPVL